MPHTKLFIAAILILPICMFAQEWPLDPCDHYVIQKAYLDSVDITDEYVTNGAFVKFYPVGMSVDSFFMANIRPKSHSQSYGMISDISHDADQYEGKKIDVIEFTWNYRNTYDMNSGYANIRLFKIHYDDYMEFAIFITPETDKEIFYSGIIEKQITY